jgi:glycosyltransferase involved in cell wall biosynthesis
MRIGYLMQEGGPDVRRPPFTGPANHVRQVCYHLRNLGHEVCLIARYEDGVWRSDDLEEYERIETPELEVGVRRKLESAVRRIQAQLGLPYFNYFDSIRFAHACISHLPGCDLLYERFGWMGIAGGITARRMGIPQVLEVNNGDFLQELRMLGQLPRGLQLNVSVRLMRRVIQQADLVVASGEGHRQKLIELWQADQDKVQVVENGSELVEILSRNDLRSFLPQEESQGAVRLVFAGAFEPWQGVDILLEALRRLRDEGCPVELTLAGSGSEFVHIEQLIERLNLGALVDLKGSLGIKELAAVLASSDIGIAPYCGWSEFSGLKLFDYKSAGLAIVISGEDGRPTTIEQNRTGIIVRPCDVQDLTQALRRLVEDRELRCALGRAARLEAEAVHSWRSTAQRLETLFRSITS